MPRGLRTGTGAGVRHMLGSGRLVCERRGAIWEAGCEWGHRGDPGKALGRGDGSDRGMGQGRWWRGPSLGISPLPSSLLAVDWNVTNIPEGILCSG